MEVRSESSMVRLLVAAGIVAVVGATSAMAGTYPGTKCVSDKQKEAGKYCKSVLKEWGKWDKSQDETARDAKLAVAQSKLAAKWTKVEVKAAAKGSDCADTTPTSAAMAALMDSAMGAIVDEINAGLDLVGSSEDKTCGQKLLKAASKKCASFLKEESKYLKKLAKDPTGAARDEKQAKASAKFTGDWTKATTGGCSNLTAVEGDVEAMIDALSDEVVFQTTVSPNVPTQWTQYEPPASVDYEGRTFTPTCVKDTPYIYGARRGSVNKLVIYYMGGGACWESLTCALQTCTQESDPDLAVTLNSQTAGFADYSDPSNPFKDWNAVFVTYCSCDIHFGDIDQHYANPIPIDIKHFGYQNARVVEKWTREHFVNPDEIFVTGSSAGAYGALFNAPLHARVWPASHFDVLGDAGNGVITSSFLQNEFNNWNFQANLPSDIPGVLESITTGNGMPAYIEAVTDFFSTSNWAHYTTAFDGGGGGQTGFYNIMLNSNNPAAAATWWDGSCAFNSVMRQQAIDTAAAVAAVNDNYRYYIGTGSRHTMWGSDKVYSDTTGGVPTVVDWVNAMLASAPGSPDPGWTNVEASPSNVLLSGDPRPSPLEAPFELSGADTIVNCGPSPSGAFLDVAASALD